jgi:hypothetical protein
MNRFANTLLATLLGLMLAGCNNTETVEKAPTQAATASTSATPGAPADSPQESSGVVVPPDLTPQETVMEYLQAAKEGNEDVVAALLTEVARSKTAEDNIAVSPPGRETANFSVGNMEYVTPDKKTAHVASMWTDNDEQDKPQTLRIVWVVKQEPAGWRVAGMVTRLTPDQPLMVLNFEEPKEVIRKVEEEMARRRAASAKTQQVGVQTAPGGEVPPAGAENGEGTPRQVRGASEFDLSAPR